MRRKLFGTDGIRGIANAEPMTVETATAVGRAVAYHFRNSFGKHKIVIGKDTRLSGYMFETALSAGILSMGGDVLLVGPLTTPGIAFITASMRADAGVVISASHNPFYDNGIKIFGGDGFKLPDDVEGRIEELMTSSILDEHRPGPEDIGKASRIEDATGRYVVYLKSTFPKRLTLDGIKVVVDCGNGAGYRAAPSVFQELGAQVKIIGGNPDGFNINKDCGSLHPENISQMVRDEGANLGICLDGDGDRCIIVDDKGDILNGDHIMAVCGINMLQEKKLKKKTIVATMMSNIGFELAMEKAGVRVKRADVGDRYVIEEMRRGNFNFGGEQSGHIIFLDHATTGDGILASLQLMKVVIQKGRPLSELRKVMEDFPQVLLNLEVDRKIPLRQLRETANLIRDYEKNLIGRGRLYVRYSGTEHLLRIMVEGEDQNDISHIARHIAEKATREIKRYRS
ncbi:MAG: phosphoglucosamine mutase [Deltaproteobacteria bacterium]|nr:phosphoglucosamine mutase [Deltaproteobacteria bacterium]NIS77898.1 phosphoglucosamine mutase [Deltaproteobacteria bacterium]